MKRLIVVILLTMFAVCITANEAVIRSVKGKVECSSDGETWYAAEVNKTLKPGDFISISFKSSAVILINDSIINVKALTRMSIDELAKSSSGPPDRAVSCFG